MMFINIVTLVTAVFLAGRAEHMGDEVSEKIDELSMIESKLVGMLDEFAVIMSYRREDEEEVSQRPTD